MASWSALSLPYIFERMVGFSLPMCNQVAIISYEGLHFLDLNRPDHVLHDNKHREGGKLYSPSTGKLLYQGREYSILGLHGGAPISASAQGERLALDLPGEVLMVYGASGNVDFEFRFEDPSGDWGHASFSSDGEHILLGMPYEIHLLRRVIS